MSRNRAFGEQKKVKTNPSGSRALAPPFIDIEASGFGRGTYPIEVGVALADRSAQCFLIRPLPSWTHWDERAQSFHQLTRRKLFDHGADARSVATELNALLQGQTVYTDAWSYDLSWLQRLFEATSLSQLFRLEAVTVLLDEREMEAWAQVKESVVRDFGLQRHRASFDARILQETYVRVKKA